MARSVRRNVNKSGALGMAAVGAALGATATLASSLSGTMPGKFVIGTLTGAVVGAVIGAVIPHGRASNPMLGAATTILAGTSMLVAPPVVAAALTKPKAA